MGLLDTVLGIVASVVSIVATVISLVAFKKAKSVESIIKIRGDGNVVAAANGSIATSGRSNE